MAGKARKEENRLLVTLSNQPLDNYVGEPWKLQWYDEETEKVVLRRADLALVIRSFLRTSRDGRTNTVITSAEDSQHARSLGIAMQQAEDGRLTMTLNDHKWLLGKFREFGHFAFPTDAAIVLEVLEQTQESRGPAPTKEEDDAEGKE